MRSVNTSAFKIGLLSNPWLNAAILTALVLQVAAIHLPFMQKLFDTVPLTAYEWFLIVLISSTVLWVGEIRKRLFPLRED
jgi:Ca2+-transporting ATPase